MKRARTPGRAGDVWEGRMPDGTPVRGVALGGSPNVRINNHPALRAGDAGLVITPGGPRLWRAARGAPTVRINGEPMFRRGDPSVGR